MRAVFVLPLAAALLHARSDLALLDQIAPSKLAGDFAPLDAATGDCLRGDGVSVCFHDGFAHVGVRAYERQ